MKYRLYAIISSCCLLCMLLTLPTQAQQRYSSFSQLTDQLRTLADEHQSLAELSSLGESPGGREIWMLTIAEGNASDKPAIAVIGGAKGSHIIGSQLTLRFAEDLLSRSQSDSIRSLLEQTTFYVLPRINPDATEQYFSNLLYERDGNATETDADRDGDLNEDPYEDLNGDGMITMMRISDRTGDRTTHDKDARVMVKRNETNPTGSGYRLLSEGRDNDEDDKFNEDGPGGVNINMNFTYDYPYFQPGAGNNMASQPETRAVMDFLFEKGWNVFSVVSFGPENNLSQPLSFNGGAVSQRVISGWYEDDIGVNRMVSDLYNDTVSLTDAPEGPPQQGDLFQWAYYHYGRFSFSTPGWWIPPIMDEEGNAKDFKNEDAHYLAWADSQNVDGFVAWQEVDHPDFPTKTVEVGGVKPFARSAPPYSAVDSTAAQHTDFLIQLAQMRPNIELTNFETESVGEGLHRITVDIYNAGQMPTASKVGEQTRWVRGVNVELTLPDEMAIVSGRSYQSFESIKASESKTISWLVRGSGSYSITAGAPTAGFSTMEKTIR